MQSGEILQKVRNLQKQAKRPQGVDVTEVLDVIEDLAYKLVEYEKAGKVLGCYTS